MNRSTTLTATALAFSLLANAWMLVGGDTSAAPVGKRNSPFESAHVANADEPKAAVLARLEREATAGVAPWPADYWSHDAAAPLRFALGVSHALDDARQRLIERYGNAAVSDTAFARVFRPLDPEFHFLGSAEQIQLQRLLWQLQIERIGAPLAPDYSQVRARLAAVLSPSSLLEYELRRSPLASQLRDSGIDLDEAEFREAFQLLRAFESGDGEIGQFVQMRRHLKRLLGTARYTKLMSANDPLFAAVRSAAQRHSLAESSVNAVYSVLINAQDAMLEASDKHQGNPASLGAALEDIRGRQDRQIAGLVGESVAEDILGAVARRSPSLAQDDGTSSP